MQTIIQVDEIGLEMNMLQCMSEAAAWEHELDQWIKVKNGFEARCRKCGLATFASSRSLFSFLEDNCIDTLPHSAHIDFGDQTETIDRGSGLFLRGYSQVKSFFYHLMYLPDTLFKITR